MNMADSMGISERVKFLGSDNPMESKIPNFFIVGAPKSGTTSIASYLGDHPNIFLSNPKEPNFFARHLTIPNSYLSSQIWHTSFSGYLELFASCQPHHMAIGEASTRYLRCERALKDIKEFNPHAKIVVCLRNPVHLIVSWHAQKVRELQEPELNFEKAWKLEKARRQGRKVPKGLESKDALYYSQIALLGTQVETVLQIFDRQKIKFIFFEDLCRTPHKVYQELVEFLGVPLDRRDNFQVLNVRTYFRWSFLPKVFANMPPLMRQLLNIDNIIASSFGVKYFITTNRPNLRSRFHNELLDLFRDEILKLQALTNRDLTEWLS